MKKLEEIKGHNFDSFKKKAAEIDKNSQILKTVMGDITIHVITEPCDYEDSWNMTPSGENLVHYKLDDSFTSPQFRNGAYDPIPIRYFPESIGDVPTSAVYLEFFDDVDGIRKIAFLDTSGLASLWKKIGQSMPELPVLTGAFFLAARLQYKNHRKREECPIWAIYRETGESYDNMPVIDVVDFVSDSFEKLSVVKTIENFNLAINRYSFKALRFLEYTITDSGKYIETLWDYEGEDLVKTKAGLAAKGIRFTFSNCGEESPAISDIILGEDNGYIVCDTITKRDAKAHNIFELVKTFLSMESTVDDAFTALNYEIPVSKDFLRMISNGDIIPKKYTTKVAAPCNATAPEAILSFANYISTGIILPNGEIERPGRQQRKEGYNILGECLLSLCKRTKSA